MPPPLTCASERLRLTRLACLHNDAVVVFAHRTKVVAPATDVLRDDRGIGSDQVAPTPRRVGPTIGWRAPRSVCEVRRTSMVGQPWPEAGQAARRQGPRLLVRCLQRGSVGVRSAIVVGADTDAETAQGHLSRSGRDVEEVSGHQVERTALRRCRHEGWRVLRAPFRHCPHLRRHNHVRKALSRGSRCWPDPLPAAPGPDWLTPRGGRYRSPSSAPSSVSTGASAPAAIARGPGARAFGRWPSGRSSCEAGTCQGRFKPRSSATSCPW